jgi:hypothetical protein
MKRIAVFGNAGAGKSALARRLAELTGLPLHVIDEMQFAPGGEAVPPEDFLKAHADLIRQDEWIIDGYGTTASVLDRFKQADMLVHVDPSLSALYWGVTARFIKGMFGPVPGWPPRSPLWSSTLSSYKTIPKCHRHLTPTYRQLVAEAASSKRVHHLKSRADIAIFTESVAREMAAARQG